MLLNILRQKFLSVLKSLLIIPYLFILTGCDSSEEVNVTEVSVSELLSDAELHGFEHHFDESKSGYIHFGFDLRSSPQEDIAQYLPLMNYLARSTGYKFKLEVIPKNSSIISELKEGHIHLAAMGAVNDIRSEEAGIGRTLVQGLNKHNKASYQSMFIVKPDSAVQTIADIKNKKMAFGDRSSTQGHLIPRIILEKNHIKLSDFMNYDYLGSHQLCAEAVVSGKFDVCALQDMLAKDLAERGLVRIIHASEYYPSSGIVVSTALNKDVALKIKQALLDFKPHGEHKAGLYNWHMTEMPNGFVAANESAYKELKGWLVKLNLL